MALLTHRFEVAKAVICRVVVKVGYGQNDVATRDGVRVVINRAAHFTLIFGTYKADVG